MGALHDCSPMADRRGEQQRRTRSGKKSGGGRSHPPIASFGRLSEGALQIIAPRPIALSRTAIRCAPATGEDQVATGGDGAGHRVGIGGKRGRTRSKEQGSHDVELLHFKSPKSELEWSGLRETPRRGRLGSGHSAHGWRPLRGQRSKKRNRNPLRRGWFGKHRNTAGEAFVRAGCVWGARATIVVSAGVVYCLGRASDRRRRCARRNERQQGGRNQPENDTRYQDTVLTPNNSSLACQGLQPWAEKMLHARFHLAVAGAASGKNGIATSTSLPSARRIV